MDRVTKPLTAADLMLARAKADRLLAKGIVQHSSETSSQEEQVAAVVATAETFDLANNPIQQILSAPSAQKSDEAKLKEIAEYITAKDLDYNSAQARFAEYHACLSASQGQRTQLTREGIKKFIDDLETAEREEVEKIVSSIVVVQKGTAKIKTMLKVLNASIKARTSIEDITAAFELNDKTKQQMESLNRHLEALEQRKAREAAAVATHLTSKTDSESGVLNKTTRFVWGPSKEIARALKDARDAVNSTLAEIESSTAQLKGMEGKYDQDLADGPLTLIRSLDAPLTTKTFRPQVRETAQDCLNLIATTQTSLERMLVENNRSRDASRSISSRLATAEGIQTILQGALKLAIEATDVQAIALNEQVSTAKDAITQAGENIVAKTLAEGEAQKIAATYSESLEYKADLRRKSSSFDRIAKDRISARATASEFASLVQTQYEVLESLHEEALPELASGLELSLETVLALRSSALIAATAEIVGKAKKENAKSLDQLTEAQDQIEEGQLMRIRDAIEELERADKSVEERTSRMIKHGLDMQDAMSDLSDAANKLKGASLTFQELSATLAARVDRSDVDSVRSTEVVARDPLVNASEAGPKTPLGGGALRTQATMALVA